MPPLWAIVAQPLLFGVVGSYLDFRRMPGETIVKAVLTVAIGVSFRTGMAHYVLPKPGRFYIFPAWQPHSVMPFRGDGARWSLAFNVMAIPQPQANTAARNLSLSSNRPRRQGF